jgi:hypothetical protein
MARARARGGARAAPVAAPQRALAPAHDLGVGAETRLADQTDAVTVAPVELLVDAGPDTLATPAVQTVAPRVTHVAVAHFFAAARVFPLELPELTSTAEIAPARALVAFHIAKNAVPLLALERTPAIDVAVASTGGVRSPHLDGATHDAVVAVAAHRSVDAARVIAVAAKELIALADRFIVGGIDGARGEQEREGQGPESFLHHHAPPFRNPHASPRRDNKLHDLARLESLLEHRLYPRRTAVADAPRVQPGLTRTRTQCSDSGRARWDRRGRSRGPPADCVRIRRHP